MRLRGLHGVAVVGLLVVALAAGCTDDKPASGTMQVTGDHDASGGVDSGGQDARVEDVVEDVAGDVAEDAVGDATVGDAAVADADASQDTGYDVLTRGDTGDVGEEVGPTIAEQCFGDINTESTRGPQYDTFEPTVGTHCAGTNQQDIRGVGKVVFFGDSVTQGTPNDLHPLCVDHDHFYRNLLAEWLATRFGLDRGSDLDWGAWKSYSCLYDGVPGRVESGDFKNCSKWGARTDDFLGDVSCGGRGADEARCCAECCHGGVCQPDGRCVRAAGTAANDDFCGADKQIFQCLPEGASEAPTLFIFTMGGNDIAAITQDGAVFTSDTPEGAAEINAGYPSMWALATSTVDYLEEAVRFLKDPARFPNGSWVVFANPFEFTDGTGDVSACSPTSINIPGIGPLDISALGLNIAEIGGFGAWERPEVQEEIVIWITEQYLRIAVELEADMVWMLEHFCGHGYVAAGAHPDTTNRCFRADDPSLWFDISCIHPNDLGHEAIFRLFQDVIRE